MDALDPDNDQLVYTLVDGPNGMTIDASTGVVTWSPSAGDMGASKAITVRVDDGRGGFDEQRFTVDVTAGGGEIRGVVFDGDTVDPEANPPSPRLDITVSPTFNEFYSAFDLGRPPGVTPPLGGLTLKPDDPNVLLIGGRANSSDGQLYAVELVRGPGRHIVGFSGTADSVCRG